MLGVYDCYDEVLNEKESIQFTLDNSEISMIYDKTLLTQNLSQQKYEMSAKVIVSRILLKFFEQRTLFDAEYPEWLNEFMIYINNPSTFGQSTRELAKYTPYSYSRLTTLFKQYVGITIVDYVNDKKWSMQNDYYGPQN